MKLNEFLQALFSNRGSPFQKAAQLQRGHKRLKEAFDQFAQHLANSKGDPQFFKESVQVDISALDKSLITLKAFGADEIRISLQVMLDRQEVKGKAIFEHLRGSDLARLGEQAERRPIGFWEFEENGDTTIKLDSGAPLNMNAPREAVALVVGVLLATYSAEEMGHV